MSPEVLLLIISVPLLAVLLAGLRRVPDGTAYTVRRFGRYARTLGPGLRFRFEYDYCKGCGVCAAECPCGAIEMVPEEI